MEESRESLEKTSLLQTTTTSYTEKVLALFALFGSMVTIVTSATCVQLLERSIPDMELNVFRFVSSFVAMVILFLFKGRFPWLPKSEAVSILFCGTMSFVETTCYFGTVSLLALATAESIAMSSVIISSLILFTIFSEETISLTKTLSAILCICGVFFVIQPDVVFHNGLPGQSQNEFFEEVETRTEINMTVAMETNKHRYLGDTVGYVLAVAVGIAFSAYTLVMKRRPVFTENSSEVLFWTYLLGMIMSTVGMVTFEHPVLVTEWGQLALVAMHCGTFIFKWPMYMFGLKYVSGNVAAMVTSTTVVLMLIPQYTVLSSILPGHKNWMEVAGVVLVLLGSAMASAVELLVNQTRGKYPEHY